MSTHPKMHCSHATSAQHTDRTRPLTRDRFLPIQMALWGTVQVSQFWLTGRTSFLITRFFIALLSSGLIANIILYFSYFYTSIELPFRLTIFVSGHRINDIISPLLALGILRLRGTAGKEGWRWYVLDAPNHHHPPPPVFPPFFFFFSPGEALAYYQVTNH